MDSDKPLDLKDLKKLYMESPESFGVEEVYVLLEKCTYRDDLDFMKYIYKHDTQIDFLEEEYEKYCHGSDINIFTAYMAFQFCIKSCRLDMAKWLYTIVPDIDLAYNDQHFLSLALGYSNIEFIEWLLSIHDYEIKFEHFYKVCHHCFVDGIDFILKIKPDIDIYGEDYSAFYSSSFNVINYKMNTDIELLTKLFQVHDAHVDKDKHKNVYNEAHYYYHMFGFTDEADWIYDKFHDDIDLCYNNNQLLIDFMSNNKVYQLSWLKEKKPDIDLLWDMDEVSKLNHKETILWYVYNCPDFDISFNNEQLFRTMCRYNINLDNDTIRWLIEYKPDIDVEANNHAVFKLSCLYNDLNLATFLVSLRPDKYSIYPSIDDDTEEGIKCEIRDVLTFESEIKTSETCETCCICYNNKCDIITNCNHKYCIKCLTDWRNKSILFSCPYCKNEDIKLYKMVYVPNQ